MRARVLYVHARKIFSPRFPEKKKTAELEENARGTRRHQRSRSSLALFFLILFSSLPVAPKKSCAHAVRPTFPNIVYAKRERRLGLSVDEVVNQQFRDSRLRGRARETRDFLATATFIGRYSRARVKLIASCHWQPFCVTRNECGFLAENAGSVRERTRRVATFHP